MKNRYVRRVGKKIHDLSDNPFLLKGVGIGSWLYLEGYMLKSYKNLDRQRRFEDHINKLVGKDYCDYFFKQYRNIFFTKQDIKLIKEKGFNSIRIPLDYAFLFQPSELKVELDKNSGNWNFLDKIIEVCQSEGVYVILDLHAAPGGQTGTNIDNSKLDKPELFTNPIYQDQTVFVWESLAEHYRDYPIIACYDLLNEPLPKWFSQYNNQLAPLYKRIIKAIRKIDPFHMVTVEGTVWSTDWEIFDSLWDENILLQFHKYWSPPDRNSLREYLEKRESLNVPIFMGEGGENNLLWYSSVFPLYEQLDISYNFWTYKKMDTENSIISFKEPENWTDLLEKKCNRVQAEKILDELLVVIKFKECIIKESVISHIQRKDNFIMNAYAFDDYGQNNSYCNNDNQTLGVIKSHTHIEILGKNKEVINPKFNQYGGELVPNDQRLWVYLKKGEWVQYTFLLSQSSQGVIIIHGQFIENALIYLNNVELKKSGLGFQFKSECKKNILRIVANHKFSFSEIKIESFA